MCLHPYKTPCETQAHDHKPPSHSPQDQAEKSLQLFLFNCFKTKEKQTQGIDNKPVEF